MADKKLLVVKCGKPVSKRLSTHAITDEDKGYARIAVRLKVARAIWTLWDNLREDEGLNQAWLVDRLGSNKGRVSRLMNNPGNWTLDTVADLLEAMEARLTLVQVKHYREVNEESSIEPSLSGMRDHPSLWSVIIRSVEGEEDNEPEILELKLSTSRTLEPIALSHIVSSESA